MNSLYSCGECAKCGRDCWRLGRVADGRAEFFCFYDGSAIYLPSNTANNGNAANDTDNPKRKRGVN